MSACARVESERDGVEEEEATSTAREAEPVVDMFGEEEQSTKAIYKGRTLLRVIVKASCCEDKEEEEDDDAMVRFGFIFMA